MSKPSQVARMLKSCVEMKIPCYMSGAVGIGKSQIAKQVCDDLRIEFTDVRLSQMDPTDIKGFPSPNAAKGVMSWLPADFLPTKGKGLLFLDELVSAPTAVQAAAYQLILDRKVGNYTLPPGWAIAGAGNRASDRSIVNKMPAALANRLVHLNVDVDLDDWVAFAINAGIDASTIAFLRFRSNLLHSFDASANPVAFPSPRAWFTVDKIVKAKLPQADEYALVQGTVGDGAAAEHAAFLRVMQNLPTPDEIKISPDSTVVPSEPATLYALTTSLALATDIKTFPRFLQYVERMEPEWQVVYVRDALKKNNKVKFEKSFTAWSIAHSDVVL